ncbi:MAG: peptidoglycan-binding protein [Tissierellia bacterium]|nr:peptidoglycan-binding protein [Tissierellia bacterium]
MKKSKKILLLVLALVMILSLAACGGKTDDNAGEGKVTEEGKEPENQDGDKEGQEGQENTETAEKELVLRRAYYAAHGEKAFGRFLVAMDGDTFVAANIDEYQFGNADGENTFVPNFDKGFGQGFAEGKALYSKSVNFDLYSKNMAEKAKATKTLDENYKAIEEFVVGKTVAEVEKVISEAADGKPVDAVSGSTLVDTKGYLMGLVEAAKNTDMEAKGKASDPANVKLAFVLGAPHGEKSFADTAVLVEGDKLVAANIDEFQFFGEGQGVPNSDKGFGENYAEGKLLGSKKVNSESYSKNMTEKAKATKTLDENYRAIEEFVVGKTIADLEKVFSEAADGKPVDAISGSTLVDTKGYLGQIIEAAKAVK